MSLLQKPTNIYHTEEEKTNIKQDSWMNEFEDMFKTELGEKVVEETLKQDKIQEFDEPNQPESQIQNELSYEQKLEFVKKFAEELNLEFTMKVTPSIKDKTFPEVTPTIEPVVEPEPVVEEVKVQTPKETEKTINFNFEKPEGWNKKRKKTNFLKVLLNGILGVDMEPSDFRRYEKFTSNMKPVIVILLIATFVVSGFYFKSNDVKKSNVFDRVFNFCVEKYDNWTGRNKKFITNDSINVQTIDSLLYDSNKITHTPLNFDTIDKKDTTFMEDWEKQYEQLKP